MTTNGDPGRAIYEHLQQAIKSAWSSFIDEGVLWGHRGVKRRRPDFRFYIEFETAKAHLTIGKFETFVHNDGWTYRRNTAPGDHRIAFNLADPTWIDQVINILLDPNT